MSLECLWVELGQAMIQIHQAADVFGLARGEVGQVG